MPHPIKALKGRLASVSDETLRYRLVNGWFKQDKIEGAKACTFYWVMIPASLFGEFWLGVFFVIFMVAVRPIAWILGYSMIPSDEKLERLKIKPAPRADIFLPRGFSPTRNVWRKHNPWYYLLPIFTISVIAAIFMAAGPSAVGLGFRDFAVAAAPYVLALAGICLALIMIGKLIRKGRGNMRMYWARVCPPLKVVHENVGTDNAN